MPFDVGTASGASIIGKYMYVTSWRNFSIYDVSDPLAPALVTTIPFGFKFENEDVDSNGEIMIFSEDDFRRAVSTSGTSRTRRTPSRSAALDGGRSAHDELPLELQVALRLRRLHHRSARIRRSRRSFDNMWNDGLSSEALTTSTRSVRARVLTASDPMMSLGHEESRQAEADRASDPKASSSTPASGPGAARTGWLSAPARRGCRLRTRAATRPAAGSPRGTRPAGRRA